MSLHLKAFEGLRTSTVSSLRLCASGLAAFDLRKPLWRRNVSLSSPLLDWVLESFEERWRKQWCLVRLIHGFDWTHCSGSYFPKSSREESRWMARTLHRIVMFSSSRPSAGTCSSYDWQRVFFDSFAVAIFWKGPSSIVGATSYFSES